MVMLDLSSKHGSLENYTFTYIHYPISTIYIILELEILNRPCPTANIEKLTRNIKCTSDIINCPIIIMSLFLFQRRMT